MRKLLQKSTIALLVIASLATFGTAAAPLDKGKANAPGQIRKNPPVAAFASISSGNSIVGGVNNTCGVLTNGTVACWGNNFYGQTGNALTGTVNYNGGLWSDDAVTVSPSIVTGLVNVSKVSVGRYTACAISNSALHCWGSNQLGQLGQGAQSFDANPAPVLVNLPNVTDVRLDSQGVCAISNGALYCWGTVGDLINVPTPTLHAGTLDSVIPSTNPCIIAAGIVTCSGANWAGELGNGTTNNLNNPPTQVSVLTTATQVTAGANHRCALVSSGDVYCWGWNWYGQLGLGTAGVITPGLDGENFDPYYGSTAPWIYTTPTKVVI